MRVLLTFQNLIANESGCLAQTLLQLEESIVGPRVEHSEFLTAISVALNFEAKRLWVKHLA